MVFIKNDNFGLIWSSAENLKNIQNVNGVRLKMPTSPALTPLTRCHFITKKISYNKEVLAFSQYKCKKTKNYKKRITKEHSRLKIQHNY
jgi:hypothetical protein